jgi:ACS family sodium-dependent inorganic phosphate cotransporter
MYGARKVIFIAMFLSAVITSISPFAANDNFIFMFIMRLILGVLAGFFYPASHQLISKWAPIDEKGKFVFTLMGGIFGTLVTWPLTGYLAEHHGWRSGFHIPALISFVIAFLWLYLVHDSPSTHPRITKGEKELIEKSIGASTSGKKAWPPMQDVLTCPRFYALLLLHFGGTFGLFFLITAAPKFMSEVLKFNLTEAGILASLPYLARLCFGYVFGTAGDFLKSKNILSTTSIRKTFCIFCEYKIILKGF